MRQFPRTEAVGYADQKAWDLMATAKPRIENLSVDAVKAGLQAGTAVPVDICDIRQ